jgi:hypothetical protein
VSIGVEEVVLPVCEAPGDVAVAIGDAVMDCDVPMEELGESDAMSSRIFYSFLSSTDSKAGCWRWIVEYA